MSHFVLQFCPRGGFPMSKVFSIRLPEKLAEELDRLCQMTGRRRNALIQTALQSYVRHFADYEIKQKEKHEKDFEKLVKTLKKTLKNDRATN